MSTKENWYARAGAAPHYQGQIADEGTGKTIAITYDDKDGENAQLIAAAPDMLKALQRAAALVWFTVATMPEGSLRDDVIYTHTLIRNALNKAGKGTQ